MNADQRRWDVTPIGVYLRESAVPFIIRPQQ
jgi:hypothetical protein